MFCLSKKLLKGLPHKRLTPGSCQGIGDHGSPLSGQIVWLRSTGILCLLSFFTDHKQSHLSLSLPYRTSMLSLPPVPCKQAPFLTEQSCSLSLPCKHPLLQNNHNLSLSLPLPPSTLTLYIAAVMVAVLVCTLVACLWVREPSREKNRRRSKGIKKTQASVLIISFVAKANRSMIKWLRPPQLAC